MSVVKSDSGNWVSDMQEYLSFSSDDLTSEEESEDSLLDWLYVKREVRRGTMEIVFTSLLDLEGDVKNENYLGLKLEKDATREDYQEMKLDAKVMKSEDENDMYCQATSLKGKDESYGDCELNQTKEGNYFEEVYSKKSGMCKFLVTGCQKSDTANSEKSPNYITDPLSILASRSSIKNPQNKKVVENASCQSTNRTNCKAALGNKFSSDSGVPNSWPKNFVSGKPRTKSSHLLSKEALAIFSASTKPVHKDTTINKNCIKQSEVKNVSCPYADGMDHETVLEKKSVCSVTDVPKIMFKKSVLFRPRMKSSQLLSKDALAIFSASNQPGNKIPMMIKNKFEHSVVKNTSCQYANGIDHKAVLRYNLVSNESRGPKITLKKSVLVRPRMNINQLLS